VKRVGASAIRPINRKRLRDGEQNDDEDSAAERALQQIQMQLRERNEFPTEKKIDHGAAEENEGVSDEPELVGRLRFYLGLAARLGERFAHFGFLGKFSDGLGHNY